MPKKPRKKEFRCPECKYNWTIYDPEGIVRCDSCGKVAIQIIRAPNKWKRTPRGQDNNIGGDSFEGSPSYENAVKHYENG
jgi:hypothetical protein